MSAECDMLYETGRRAARTYRRAERVASDVSADLYETVRFRLMRSDFRAYVRGGLKEACDRAVSLILSVCESTFEQDAAFRLLKLDYGPHVVLPRVALAAALEGPHEDGMTICPQLSFGSMRVDFGLVAQRGGSRTVVALECDGEGFHLDKERDRRRDQRLLCLGVRTIRIESARDDFERHDAFGELRAVLAGAPK